MKRNSFQNSKETSHVTSILRVSHDQLSIQKSKRHKNKRKKENKQKDQVDKKNEGMKIIACEGKIICM